jgi:hypothetical protein
LLGKDASKFGEVIWEYIRRLQLLSWVAWFMEGWYGLMERVSQYPFKVQERHGSVPVQFVPPRRSTMNLSVLSLARLSGESLFGSTSFVLSYRFMIVAGLAQRRHLEFLLVRLAKFRESMMVSLNG